MVQTPPDFEQSAFEFIEQLDRRSTANEIVDAMHDILGGYGVEFFCICGFPTPTQRFEDVAIVNRVPAEWLKIYLERQYVHVDHALRFCKRTTRPFEWKDAPYDPEREPRTAEYVRGARDFGLTQGLLVPAHGPTGPEGLVWMGGTKLSLPPHHKETLHLIALYAFDRVRYLHPSVSKTAAVLTSREREVLLWTARGKSAWEIGEILNIGKRTVDTHTQATFRKLGAVNRVHAVAIAIRDGLMDV